MSKINKVVTDVYSIADASLKSSIISDLNTEDPETAEEAERILAANKKAEPN